MKNQVQMRHCCRKVADVSGLQLECARGLAYSLLMLVLIYGSEIM